MKKNFSHGSADQMIDAFENKIEELGGHTESIESATDVDYEPSWEMMKDMLDDIEQGYGWADLDYLSDAFYEEHGIDVSVEQIKDLLESHGYHTYTIDDFDIINLTGVDDEEIKEELGIEASSDINCADEFEEDVEIEEVDEDEGYRDRYIHALIGDVDWQLRDISRGNTWDQDDENIYLTMVVDDGRVLDFTIPLSDLTMDFDDIETSVQYIVDTVRYAFDHPEDEIEVEDEEPFREDVERAEDEIQEIIEQYMPDLDSVRTHVEEWYSEHQGDPAYDVAHDSFTKDPRFFGDNVDASTDIDKDDELEQDGEHIYIKGRRSKDKDKVECADETDLDEEAKHHLEEKISEFLFDELNDYIEHDLVEKVISAVPEYKDSVNIRATQAHWEEREEEVDTAKQAYVKALLQALIEDRA